MRLTTPRRTTAASVLLVVAALAVLLLPAGGGGQISGTTSAAAAVDHRFGSVRASAVGPGYAFSSVLDGRPVRWNPCQPIRWAVNLSGAPAGALPVLRSAVARVAAASGTTWTYVGATTTRPTSAVLPKAAQPRYPAIVLGWTDARSSDLLRAQPRGVLAMTRTAWFGVRKADGSKVAATRAAVIAFDRTDRLPLRGAVSWHTVALHELGHTMGLAHVGAQRQLMATVLPRNLSDLQNGDRAGLTRLGRTAGCVHVPS
jgi:hypothetical protein